MLKDSLKYLQMHILCSAGREPLQLGVTLQYGVYGLSKNK